MHQSQEEFARVDTLEVGLDRASLTSTDQIKLPESQVTENPRINPAEVDNPDASSQGVVDAIKLQKHKAGVKIRKKLHIGRASDDRELATVAIAGDHEASDSRYTTDAPDSDRATFKDFVKSPIDAVRAKVSEHSHKQCADQITAKEVPHGDEVDLLHASDAVEAAQTDTQRLLAIQNLSELMKQRQATYARWTLDRHVRTVRPLPRDQMKLKPRSDFEKYNPQEGLVIDWKAYGQHLLVYYAHQYGGQYVGYGSEPPAPTKHAMMPTIERFLIASSPLQDFVMQNRRIYQWDHPPTTAIYLLTYSILWYYDMLVPGCLAAVICLVIGRRSHGRTVEDLRKDIRRQEDQRTTATSLTELIVKEGDESWSYELRETLGPWYMVQISDLANLLESMRNFYEWRVPHRTMCNLVMLSITMLVTALIPMWLVIKTTTFALGVMYFGLYPIAVNHPEYRLLVSPAKWFVWNIPTHAEWSIKYMQAEGTRIVQTSKQVAPSQPTTLAPFDPAHDYNSYSAHQDKTTGRLIVSAGGIRFVSNLGHSIVWSLGYDELQWLEKQDRMEHKHIPNKLQWDCGQDLKIVSKDGSEHLLKQVDKRDEAFSQVVGFSNINWQVVWPGILPCKGDTTHNPALAFRAIPVRYHPIIGLTDLSMSHLRPSNGRKKTEEDGGGDTGSAGVTVSQPADEVEQSATTREIELHTEGEDEVTEWETSGLR